MTPVKVGYSGEITFRPSVWWGGAPPKKRLWVVARIRDAGSVLNDLIVMAYWPNRNGCPGLVGGV